MSVFCMNSKRSVLAIANNLGAEDRTLYVINEFGTGCPMVPSLLHTWRLANLS